MFLIVEKANFYIKWPILVAKWKFYLVRLIPHLTLERNGIVPESSRRQPRTSSWTFRSGSRVTWASTSAKLNSSSSDPYDNLTKKLDRFTNTEMV